MNVPKALTLTLFCLLLLFTNVLSKPRSIISTDLNTTSFRINKNRLDVVIKEKDFRKVVKYAQPYHKFRVFVKTTSKYYKQQIKDFASNIKKFSIYDGMAITVEQKKLIELINQNMISEVWNNSAIFGLDNFSSNHTTTQSMSQDICNFTDMVHAPSLWKQGYCGSDSIVAILDTGILMDHPSLNQTIDGESRILSTHNFFDESDYVSDDNGHGTAIAGIIGSNGKNGYPMGVAPKCKFLIGKILSNTGDGTVETLISGIDWALENSADIINLSLGKYVSNLNSPEVEAVNNAFEAGTLVITAAGNFRGTKIFSYNSKFTLLSPGIASKSLTVGAIDSNNILYEHSSGGPPCVNYNETNEQFLYNSLDKNLISTKPDLVAPGVKINTTTNNLNSYKIVTGTSYSTAVVSGIASLLISKFPGKTSVTIKDGLIKGSKLIEINITNIHLQTTRSIPSPFYQGAGLVDCNQSSLYLETHSEFSIWPSNLDFIETSMFLNEEQTYLLHLFLNTKCDEFSIYVDKDLESIFYFTMDQQVNDIGQYDLKLIVNTEHVSSGRYSGNIYFSFDDTIIKIPISIRVIPAKGKVLIDCFEDGEISYYSLYGTLSLIEEYCRRHQLVSVQLPYDMTGKSIKDLNLNEFETIFLINPNASSSLRNPYSVADFYHLTDYMLPGGNYSGGTLVLCPSSNSDFAFINNLVDSMELTVSTTSLMNQTIEIPDTNKHLFEVPYSIDTIHIPYPLQVSGGNNTVQNLYERFAYADYTEKGGSKFIFSNSINIFLSSPYIYSIEEKSYLENRLSAEFANNSLFFRNILEYASHLNMYVSSNLNKEEFYVEDIIELRITAGNFDKIITGWNFYVTLEREEKVYLRYSKLNDYENGTYSLKVNLSNYSIPPGKYHLYLRSYSQKEKFTINIYTKFSWTPRYVEISLIFSIIVLIITKKYHKKKFVDSSSK